MVNTVIILVLIVLDFFGIRRIYRTVRYGGSCCSGSAGMEKKVRVRDRKRSNYPYSYKLKVDGLVCAGCARKVENALNSDGMLWAKADLEHREVHVLSKKETDRESFLRLLNGTSYTLLEGF